MCGTEGGSGPESGITDVLVFVPPFLGRARVGAVVRGGLRLASMAYGMWMVFGLAPLACGGSAGSGKSRRSSRVWVRHAW